jgi:magnesium transporter
MHGPDEPEQAHSAVPIPDLSGIDRALHGSTDELKAAVAKLRPADLGRDLSRRTIDEGLRILHVLDKRHAAAMLRATHPMVAAQLISRCDCAHAVQLLDFLPTDHQVAVLALVDAKKRAELDAAMDPADHEHLKQLLAYPEGVVGRAMTPKIWRAEVGSTAGAALEELRTHREDIEVAANLYIVDAGKLVGVAALREVAIAPLEAPLAELMTRDPIAVQETTGRGDAAEIVRTHDFLSLPVVDPTGKLLGAIRVDDLLDAALDHLGTGQLNQAAVQGKLAGRAPYFQTSLLRVVRSRLTWLILLFVAETATGTVLRYFEGELEKVVALSFFIPLLIGTGGNAGSQTVSMIIRALALGEVRVRDVGRVVLREVSAGVLLGLLLGVIAFGRALLWGVDYQVATCVAVTILCVCTWANAVGATIPLVAHKLGIDPTVVSAPLITTLVDAYGLFIYFSVAHLMITKLG